MVTAPALRNAAGTPRRRYSWGGRFLAVHVRSLTTAVWVVVLALLAAAAALGLKWGAADAAGVAFAVELALFLLGFTVLGVLIARREPHNAVGWLFAVPIGVLAATGGMYAECQLPVTASPAGSRPGRG